METSVENRQIVLPEFFQTSFDRKVMPQISVEDCDVFLDNIENLFEDFWRIGKLP